MYVQRNAEGEIIGRFSNRQKEIPEEWVEGAELADLRTRDDKRREAYMDRGSTPEAWLEALIEKTMEGRPEKANTLQEIRRQVKADFP